jgi:hypothetical protein
MMTNEITPDLLETVSRKFGKLMEKAKSTNSPEEAENCVALASKILWDHQIEESQLISLHEIEKRNKRHFIKDGVNIGRNKYAVNYTFNSRDWKSELLNVLAQNFFCKLNQGYDEVVTIVGEPKSIEIVKSLYNYLEAQIRASRRVAFNLAKENGEIEYANRQSRSYWAGKPRQLSQFAVHSFKNSFARGAVASIERRLSEQQKANVEETNHAYESKGTLALGYGAALVVQIHDDLDAAFYDFFPELHPAQVKLREYQLEIEHQKLTERLNAEREAREARIAAGKELPPEPPKPYKRRGRKPRYRSTLDTSAYYQGRAAGESLQINPALDKKTRALNK